MTLIQDHLGRWLACIVIILTALSTTLLGQKLAGGNPVKNLNTVNEIIAAPNASVTPVIFPGENITCANLNAMFADGAGDIRFSHIITDSELKLNFADPNGNYPFTTGGGRIVVGPQDGIRSVTISSSSNPGVVSTWSSTLPITAVNVKVGNDSYVYPYKPFAFNDTNLATGDPRGISHITFCFGEAAGPTAADATLNGRVVDASGMGIAKAQLVLINGLTGESKITMTNPFGYYSFTGLEVNELYILNVRHKVYSFEDRQRTLTLTDSFTTADFVARPL